MQTSSYQQNNISYNNAQRPRAKQAAIPSMIRSSMNPYIPLTETRSANINLQMPVAVNYLLY